MSNTQKTFFITGVSSGIGRALAEAVLNAGGRVAGTVRNPDVAADFEALSPGKALALIADVTDVESVEAAVQKAVDRFGAIDVVANNAGAGTVGAVEETSISELRTIFDLNVIGQFNVLKTVLPVLRAQKAGHILTFSAVGGFTGFAGLGVYSAAKAASDVLSEALAQEVAGFGIKTTILTLGIFRTRFAGSSLSFTKEQIPAYADTPAGAFRNFIQDLDGKQPNDPKKAAQAILQLVESDTPPLHFALGSDAIGVMRKKLDQVQADLAAWESLSTAMQMDASVR